MFKKHQGFIDIKKPEVPVRTEVSDAVKAVKPAEKSSENKQGSGKVTIGDDESDWSEPDVEIGDLFEKANKSESDDETKVVIEKIEKSEPDEESTQKTEDETEPSVSEVRSENAREDERHVRELYAGRTYSKPTAPRPVPAPRKRKLTDILEVTQAKVLELDSNIADVDKSVSVGNVSVGNETMDIDEQEHVEAEDITTCDVQECVTMVSSKVMKDTEVMTDLMMGDLTGKQSAPDKVVKEMRDKETMTEGIAEEADEEIDEMVVMMRGGAKKRLRLKMPGVGEIEFDMKVRK